MLQNEGFQHVYHRISSQWLKKNLDFVYLNCSIVKDFKTDITEYFTTVEEIFEFRWSELHQNERFQNVHHRISSPWLKKILDFDDLKCSRMKDFNMFITEYLHHGWRNFWILMLWNTPEWRISKRSSQNIFTMVEENFGFRWS